MSTKTTFKRIALVAVAALTLGTFSAVSASAATAYTTSTSSVTAVNATVATASTSIPGGTVIVNYGATFAVETATAGSGNTLSHSFVAELTAYPASSYSQVTAAAASGTAQAIAVGGDTVATDLSVAGGRAFFTATSGTNNLGFAAGTNTSSATAGIGSFRFTAAKAGTYTLSIWSDNDQNNLRSANEIQKTIDVTISAPSTYSNTYSSAYIADGNGTTAATSDGTVLAPKAISNANAGLITVTLKDATNTALSSAAGTLSDVTAVRVTASGTGFVAAKTTAGVPVAGTGSPEADICQTVANNTGSSGVIGGLRTVTISAPSSNVLHFYACADNTGGYGKIKIEVISTSGGTQILATKDVAYYGDVTTLTTSQNAKWVALGATTPSTGSTAAYTVTATDASGIKVEGLTLTATSSSSTKWSTTQTAAAGGVYSYSVTTAVPLTGPAVAGDKPKFTITDSVVATATTTAEFTISGAPKTVVLSLDKPEYMQGDVATLTVTATDALGNPVADLTANTLFGSAGLVSSIILQGSSATSGGGATGLPTGATLVTDAGIYKFKFYAPVTNNKVTIWDPAAGTTVNAVSAVITDPSAIAAQAAADAAEEAIAAAEAATEAALTAAEAADAATTAAQDASDAVVALATQVTEWMESIKAQNAALKAQITSLTNLIVKIQKKIKA